jgi:hypothetical protein
LDIKNPETALVQKNKDTLITCSIMLSQTNINQAEIFKKRIELGLSIWIWIYCSKLNLAGVYNDT